MTDIIDHRQFVEFANVELTGTDKRPEFTDQDLIVASTAPAGLQIYLFDGFILFTHVKFMAPSVCAAGGYPAHVMKDIIQRELYIYSDRTDPNKPLAETLQVIEPKTILIDNVWLRAAAIDKNMTEPEVGVMVVYSDLRAASICNGDARIVSQQLVLARYEEEGLKAIYSTPETAFRERLNKIITDGNGMFASVTETEALDTDATDAGVEQFVFHALAHYTEMVPPGSSVMLELIPMDWLDH